MIADDEEQRWLEAGRKLYARCPEIAELLFQFLVMSLPESDEERVQ